MTSIHVSKLVLPVSERDHSLGPSHSRVTVVEYGDYECPSCGKAHAVIQRLRREAGERFRYVFRNFPLTQMHPHAQHAAEAAEAAAAQGKFWEMHDLLFSNQDALADEDLLRYAEELQLDGDRFREALSRHEFAGRVREDLLSGAKSGVNGTPTFFINGVRHDGPWQMGDLLQAIQEAE